MNSGLRGRVVKLEATGAGGWRVYAGLPADEWTDRALLGFLAEHEGWPPGHVPTDAELQAIATRTEHPVRGRRI